MSEHRPTTDRQEATDAEDTGAVVNGRRVISIASVAALGGFLFGYDSAVINGAVSAIGEVFNVESTTLGFAVASALLGAAAGAMLAGRIADRFGRLRVMQIAAVLFLISALGAGFAVERRHAHRLPHHRRRRCRHGLGDRPRLHRRGRARPPPGAAGLPAAARHRHGHLRLAAGRLRRSPTAAGARRNDVLVGLQAWRWMFVAMAGPRHRSTACSP